MEKFTKEGWTEWLRKKSGPEMVYAVICTLAQNPEDLVDSVLEYVNAEPRP